MQQKITVIINTLNEELNIKRAIESVRFADEIIICDMYSEDDTAVIAKKLGAKVIFHKKMGYVEPARNFAISKAINEWVLILDADEEIPSTLADRLQQLASKEAVATFVEIPRKNIIFNKWMKASFWWPDNNIRFFKKDAVVWSDKIHSKPKTSGQGITLPAEERWAITHYNYQSLGQYIDRLNRYTDVQARELFKEGTRFNLSDLITKPTAEFLSRFFANRGFEDGLHGLSLSLLQAFSFLIVYLKLWQMDGFQEQELKLEELKELKSTIGKDTDYWFRTAALSKNPVKRFFQKAKGKIAA